MHRTPALVALVAALGMATGAVAQATAPAAASTAAPAVAPSQPPPGQAAAPQTVYSDQQMRTFAKATLDLQALGSQDPSAMSRAIEATGMTVEQYNSMGDAMRADPALAARLNPYLDTERMARFSSHSYTPASYEAYRDGGGSRRHGSSHASRRHGGRHHGGHASRGGHHGATGHHRSSGHAGHGRHHHR